MKSHHTRRKFLATSAAFVAGSVFRSPATGAQITTLVGTGMRGAAADGDLMDRATINNPFFALIGPDGALYWSDFGSNRVFRADLKTKRIAVIAGNGTKGYSGDGGPAKAAQLNGPHEVRFDSKGNMYIDERDNAIIRHVDMKSGIISTIAGSGKPGYAGDGGPAKQGQFNQPHGITLDRADNLYICDPLNNRLRRVDAKTGILTTYAGSGQDGRPPMEGKFAEVPLAGPRSLEITRNGKWYLALREGNSIFSLDPSKQTLKRIAGTGENGYSGDGGPAIAARFGSLGEGGLTGPKGLTIADNGTMFVADCENHAIRRIDMKTGIITTVAGTGKRGDGPDGDPLKCKLSRPHSVFAHGRVLYITDSENNRIRVLNI
jgi:DNA-binding beta-propeller fold protein YncE